MGPSAPCTGRCGYNILASFVMNKVDVQQMMATHWQRCLPKNVKYTRVTKVYSMNQKNFPASRF